MFFARRHCIFLICHGRGNLNQTDIFHLTNEIPYIATCDVWRNCEFFADSRA